MPTRPFYEILATMSPQRRARIAAEAKALAVADASRKAAFVDERAAAEYIEMPVQNLRRTRLSGALPGCLCKRGGRNVLYRVGDLDDFVDGQGMAL